MQANAASCCKVTAKDVAPMSDPARTWPIRLKFSLVINKSMALTELDFFFPVLSDSDIIDIHTIKNGQ